MEIPYTVSARPDTGLYNAKIGIWLFLAYLATYAGFVWLAAFNGNRLAARPWGGVNLAIIYGFILIIVLH